jgi:phospholipid/cholesterol/gamma-HCH transport system substrate-binding protein
MRRLLAMGTIVVVATVLVVVATGASNDSSGDGYQVRAIFDNAFSLIAGEDVRVSGVNVGKIKRLDVTHDNRAAVVLDITRAGFQDFRDDATCTIRPQGLIGERFVECTLTQPRPQGEARAAALKKIPDGEPGEGQRLLPVEQTSKPVDIDLVNNITRLPQRQRLAIILNELGAGLAGRAEDLNATIRRANPALGQTNRVLKILGEQNQVLRRLATDSDTVLAPLSRDRDKVADFIVQANTVSQATAERRADLERNFERLPRFLQELRPTMTRLEGFADEFEPLLTDLQAAAPDINRLFRELGPFSTASIPAVESLGDAAVVGRPALVRTKPIVDDLRGLFGEAKPLASNLKDLTTSLRDTGGIERLMDYLFFQVAAINGYDSLGHYLRAGLIVNTCTAYSAEAQPGCSSRFAAPDSDAETASAASAKNVKKLFAPKAQANAAGEDHSAAALRSDKDSTDQGGGTKQTSARTSGGNRSASQSALKLPTTMLPGQGTAPVAQAPAQPAAESADGGATPAQEGLLDYLLGGNG